MVTITVPVFVGVMDPASPIITGVAEVVAPGALTDVIEDAGVL